MANKRNKSKSSAQQDARSSQALANMRPLFTQFDFKPEHFFHRDLSLLQFFNRVLSMVDHPQTPLLERLRFLAICSTIADEFSRLESPASNNEFNLASPTIAQMNLVKWRSLIELIEW